MSPAVKPLNVGQRPEEAGSQGCQAHRAAMDWLHIYFCEGCKEQVRSSDLVRKNECNGFYETTCPHCGSEEIEDLYPCDWCGDLFTSLDDDGLCFACGPAPEAA